uniref:Uncharacterized protein n=1 Tax=Solanum lycopersicum TaxID=4081 RepID=K4CDT9_SOLLC
MLEGNLTRPRYLIKRNPERSQRLPHKNIRRDSSVKLFLNVALIALRSCCCRTSGRYYCTIPSICCRPASYVASGKRSSLGVSVCRSCSPLLLSHPRWSSTPASLLLAGAVASDCSPITAVMLAGGAGEKGRREAFV